MDIEPAYESLAPRLLLYLSSRVPEAVAEELHHDVWVAALGEPGQLTGPDLSRWLFRVARNRLISYLRRPTNRQESLGSTEIVDQSEAKAHAVNEDEVARLRFCVERLPPVYREVVRERLSGRTPDEIATQLGIARKTVDTRFYRSKEALRACIGDESP